MDAFAAVMTGKGTGAISSIQLSGPGAEKIIRKIFKPAGQKSQSLKTGKICLGTIVDGADIIDQVTIGCEEQNSFAINCHGNPLIVADIMKLLEKNGAVLVTAEKLRTKILSAQKELHTIAIEAKLALPKAKTLEGTKIIANQVNNGLNKTARGWLDSINRISPSKIKAEAGKILQAGQKAGLIISGCRICLLGPANTGKSTLLNSLAGRQKAIVTNVKGTTRDWVSCVCQIGVLYAELFDTAGLDEALSGDIERQSQEKSLQIFRDADLLLLVLDNSQPAEQFDRRVVEKITDKKILTVLNKCDLPAVLDIRKLPQALSKTVQISAKTGTGLEGLAEKIQQALGVTGFDTNQPVCITVRQKNLLEKIAAVKSDSRAAALITELLNGQICV